MKFDRLGSFGRGLSDLRKQIDSDLRRGGLPRDRVVALATAVLDRRLLRVGNGKYARENESYGLTTLTGSSSLVRRSSVAVVAMIL